MRAPAAGYASAHCLHRAASILIVGRARTLRGYHARADRITRRTRRAKDRTIDGFFDTADDRRALTRRVLRRRLHFDGEAALGVKFPVRGLDAKSAVGQFAQAAPLETWPQFKDFCDETLRLVVAVASDSARELILNATAMGIQLLHQHTYGLHHIEGLKAGDHDRALIFLGEIFIRSAADYGAD